MSVTAVKQRISDILKTMEGVQQVYDGKSVYEITVWPSFVIFTGEAQYNQLADDLWSSTRVYRLVLTAMPIELGAELAAEGACEPFYDRVFETFSVRPGLWLTTPNDPLQGVQEAKPLNDSGFVVFPVAGEVFAAVEFPLQVITYENVLRGG